VLQVDGLHLVAWLRQEVLTTQLKPMLGSRLWRIIKRIISGGQIDRFKI